MPRRSKIVEIPEQITERRIRVVCGSRSLEDRGFRDECDVFLVAHLGDFRPNDIVIDGGADGPDTWGYQIARDVGCKTIRFLPDGRLVSPSGKIGQWRSEIREPKVWEHFKERNWAMLDALEGTPGDVGLIALLDPKSKTKGAYATYNEALRRKINCKKWTANESLCSSSKRRLDCRSHGDRVVYHDALYTTHKSTGG